MIFENKLLNEILLFKPRNLEYFIDIIKADEEENNKIHELFELMKKFPASIRKFHGYYKGGLYDHILLVTNFCFNIFNKNDTELIKSYNNNYHNDFNIKNIIRAALFHDLGKLDLYSESKNIIFKYKSIEKDRVMARYYIHRDFKVTRKDDHIERCFCVIKNAELETNPTIQSGIVFHHGGWSNYRPQRSYPISALLHSGDMIASQFYHI